MRISSLIAVTATIGMVGCGEPPSRTRVDADAAPMTEPPQSGVADQSMRTMRTDSIDLFDGESLFGWHGTTDAFSVNEGQLVGRSADGAMLLTDVDFADFDLAATVRVAAGTAAELLLRAPFDATSADEVVTAIPLTVAESDGRSPLDAQPPLMPDVDYLLRVICDGGLVRTFIDGVETADTMTLANDGVPDVGAIGFGIQSGTLTVSSLSLRPLNTRSLLEDRSAEWQTNGDITVADDDGGVRISGGLGFLQSSTTSDDFLLQATVLVHTPETNSGVFFRAMEPSQPTESNGYEMQVSTEYEGDRTRPVDAGAGAIFRRQDARLVLLDAGVPTTMTLIASGDRFMTWVGGYPVVSFRDTRKDDPNPRRGRRLEAGHFLLQGHDPGTDVTYLSIVIDDYPDAD